MSNYKAQVWFQTDRFIFDCMKHRWTISSDRPFVTQEKWKEICKWCVAHRYHKQKCLNERLVYPVDTNQVWSIPHKANPPVV
jgi:hypothetical protein